MEFICNNCKKNVNENFNYCPYCGEPLNEIAKRKQQIVLQNAGLLKLHELSLSTNDPAVLKAIKNFVKK